MGDGALVGDARSWRSTPPWETGRSSVTRSSLIAAKPFPRASAGTAAPPSRRATTSPRSRPPDAVPWRRGLYAAGQLLALLLLLPLFMGGLAMLATILPGLAEHLHPEQPYEVSKARFYLDLAGLFDPAVLRSVSLGWASSPVGIVPRGCSNLLIETRQGLSALRPPLLGPAADQDAYPTASSTLDPVRQLPPTSSTT